MRFNVKKYVQDYDICMSSKAQRYKSYNKLQILPIPTYKQKDLSIDFVTRLSERKNLQEVEYDLILVIIN